MIAVICRRRFKRVLIGLLGGLVLSALGTLSTQADHQERILVIHSYHDQLPWTADLRASLDQGFQAQDDTRLIFHEFLDAKRLPALRHGETFLKEISIKYADQSLDLIMVSDDPGLVLTLEHRSTYFPNLPIVYLGINTVQPALLATPNATGIFEIHNIADTALGALEQTNTNAIIVINDSTETGKANLAEIDRLRQYPQAPREIVILNDVVDSEVKETLGRYPKNCPILLLGQLRQESKEGALASFKETARTVNNAVPNPLYAVSTTFLGHGVVGGKILDAQHHASQAVELAEQVLLQGNAAGIEPLIQTKARWVFDDAELRRFNINPTNLPADSEIINRKPSFYSQYKQLVWLTVSTFALALVIICLLIEVIRRRTIEEKLLRENETRYRDLAESGASVFWELDEDAKFIYISDETQALNVQQKTQMIGRSLYALVTRDNTLEFDWGKFLQLFYRHQPIEDFVFRSHGCTQEGQEAVRIFKINGKPFFDTVGKFLGYRGIQREITEEYQLADTLAYQATYDWLTGLVNRYEFHNQLQETIEECRNNNVQATLCYIDLDQFKIVNDTAGHLVGDKLLVEIADILKSSIRASDVLGRLGGDEFGLILKECDLSAAQEICKTLLSQLQDHRFTWKQRQFTLGCSIGAVPISCQHSTLADLLSRADLACYKAKKLGRGRVYVDAPGELGLDSDQNVMTHIASLNQYLEEKRFFLVRQKILSLKQSGHQGDHFETLIRFRDDDNDVMAPDDFIPAMEQYGVINIVDRWVLETILSELENVSSDTLISLNLSGISLSDTSFLNYTVQALKQSKLAATCLCFEITETAAISHLSEAKKFIHTLKNLGAKFALDDFGSGLSSFGYLKTLPVDFLKIDGSLVKNMVSESSDLAIVKCVNEIAHMLGMETIAEFVEDEQTLACLKELGVDYAQGYGIERPRFLEKSAARVSILA